MKIAIIPARGGSKRIKNKNIIDFEGKPLIAYTLQTAKESGLFDKIHVSTDSLEIKSVVEALGFSVDFMRPKELADDYVGTMEVLRWVLSEYGKRSEYYDTVCSILPTAPLIEAEDLKKALLLYDEHQGNFSVLPVAAYPAPIEWAFKKAKDNTLLPCQPNMFSVRSQDIENKFYDSGTFAIFSAERIFSEIPGDQGFLAYLLDRHKAVDIDDMDDLMLAKLIKRGVEA